MDKYIERQTNYYLEVETHPFFKEEVETLLREQNVEELTDRFYTELSFGTGGLRGIIGGGMNRMNPYIVRRVTYGMGIYAQEVFSEPCFVIAYDSRHYSKEFALYAALVLAQMNIRTLLFTSPRPTPMLSFALRTLRATCGIVITSSHNPPAYNGYKAYWNDGSQIIEPHDVEIIKRIKNIQGVIPSRDERDARGRGLLIDLGKEMDISFQKSVLTVCNPLVSARGKVIYTPLHGTGAQVMEAIFDKLGVEYYTVPEQRLPDGDFPTVRFPNPEDPRSLVLALTLARQKKADLLLANDPDADRIGVGVRHDNDMVLLSGNQLGALVLDYLLMRYRQNKTLLAHPVLINTVVTTDLQKKIIEACEGQVISTLTGFKHIAAAMRELEQVNRLSDFVLGTEESFGLLIGTHVRDKDGITAAALITQMMSYYHAQGQTLIDRLEYLYYTYGYYQESTISKVFEGERGVKKMNDIMYLLRSKKHEFFQDQEVLKVLDFLDQSTYMGNSTTQLTGFPKSNVLKFIFANENWIVIRPSGTEPKLKIYFSFHAQVDSNISAVKNQVSAAISTLQEELQDKLSLPIESN